MVQRLFERERRLSKNLAQVKRSAVDEEPRKSARAIFWSVLTACLQRNFQIDKNGSRLCGATGINGTLLRMAAVGALHVCSALTLGGVSGSTLNCRSFRFWNLTASGVSTAIVRIWGKGEARMANAYPRGASQR